MDYFAPNTNITFLNFDSLILSQKHQSHELNHKGQFTINFTNKGWLDRIKCQIEPCKLITDSFI